MKWLTLSLLLIAGLCQAGVPAPALQYRAPLTRNAHAVWGLDAPIATFAAQIHQESGWNSNAKSAYAGGLAQFTPATATWISGVYSRELGDNQPFNPSWAMRALVTYDRRLFNQVKGASECDRMAFALAAYNGGLGWVYKRQKLSALPGRCFDATCEINPGITAANQKENSHYPRVILLKWQTIYAQWGRGVSCLT
ncbi:MAG: lytic transglycosylase domain-containing protein [Gammaproteobacteria bacterium]|nr:lytic transglycosylase domain-containing protein [Gammaproteobacteria bacterium]MBU1978608.1 lytic transglycosylase domain-containing protein [Gammaproteobacteria bacterium]